MSSNFNPKIVYEETFKTDVIDMLIKNKYWVFADKVSSPKDIQKNISEIKKRFINTPDGLKITCFKEDKDFANLGLNPRAELRLENFKLKFKQRYKITTQVLFPHANAGFEFLQIMISGPARPTFQLEVRRNKISARHSDGKNLLSIPLLNEEPNKLIQFETEFYLDNSNNGFIYVYKDGKQIWSKQGITIHGKSSNAWLQYGVYKNGTGSNTDQSVIYKYFKLEELNDSPIKKTEKKEEKKPVKRQTKKQEENKEEKKPVKRQTKKQEEKKEEKKPVKRQTKKTEKKEEKKPVKRQTKKTEKKEEKK
jgi:hypothetical protein